jgi:8-oxo-dGTP pyrophosphatase MutT (NUDIX family)
VISARLLPRFHRFRSSPWALSRAASARLPGGKDGLYLRKIPRTVLDGGVAGAYCLPVLPDGRFVLVTEFRHQERAWRLGLPGGFREPGESGEEAARRETREETGVELAGAVRLGEVDGDGSPVPLYWGAAAAGAEPLRPDAGEALGSVALLTPDALREAIARGAYTDGQGRRHVLQAALATALVLWEAQRPIARP